MLRVKCVNFSCLHSSVDNQDGLNNYADAIGTEQGRFKNNSKDWKTLKPLIIPASR